MIEPSYIGLRQAVTTLQPGPAVSAIHKFVAEAKNEIRMPAQIRDGVYPQPVRLLRVHSDGVGVVKPQRRGHADATRRQRHAQLFNGTQTLAGQNLL